MVRETMPVLSDAPKRTKEDMAKIPEDDKKSPLGGPMSGNNLQASKKSIQYLYFLTLQNILTVCNLFVQS